MRGIAVKNILVMALLCSLCLASCSNSVSYSEDSTDVPVLEWTWVPYDSDVLQISGRTNYEKGDFLILSWSASSVTIAFRGTALEMKGWTNNIVYLDVFVDGEEDPSSLIKLTYSEEDSLNEPVSVPVVSDLPYGEHVVTLYKRTGSNFGDWRVYGMRVLGRAEKDLLPARPERRIEFVGNSIACGCDVLMPVPGQEFDLYFESSYYSYAGQTAKMLHAEEHNICSGGHGVYLNYDGSTALALPVVYNRTATLSLDAVAWDHSKWHPDIVVVNLGTNDFASRMIDSTRFVNATVNFIRKIRSYHPEAKIVLLDGPMLTGDYMVKCRQYLDTAKAILEDEGVDELYRFSFDPHGESAYNVYYHPTREEAAADAQSLTAWIRSEFGWN